MRPNVEAFEALDDLYQDIILDHYRSPRNHCLLEHSSLKVEGFNPFCGDQVVLSAQVDALGYISDMGFKGQGCAISQASASMMTDLLKGRSLEQVTALITVFKNLMKGKDIGEVALVELGELAVLKGVREYPIRIKCALLAWSALQDGIEEYQKKA